MPRAPDAVIDWLMQGDPSIRWQVQRDLLDAPRKTWQAERARVATEGWGAELLARQDRTGTWGGGLYSPKWTSTTYTLLSLREMGLDPTNAAAARGARLILDRLVHLDDPRPVAVSGCTCMCGMFLALGACFQLDDPKLDALVNRILSQQMPDGGWNCRLGRAKPAPVHSSFHTTFSVLDGVREAMARRIGPSNKLRAAEARAIELMLAHRMFKSDRTGKVIHEKFTRLSFPPRWHYDVLRGPDYLRDTAAIRDARLDDAFALLDSQRLPDGRWPLTNRWVGKVFFNTEPVGKPSRWITLRALRCLKARGIRNGRVTRARSRRASPRALRSGA